MVCPEVTLVPGEVRRMRVLDRENSEVVERVYRYVAEEQAEIDWRDTFITITPRISCAGTGKGVQNLA